MTRASKLILAGAAVLIGVYLMWAAVAFDQDPACATDETKRLLLWRTYCLSPNALGDILAGLFAPVAFIAVAAAVVLQSLELAAQREELSLTREELAKQRDVLSEQAATAAEQSKTAQHTAKLVSEQTQAMSAERRAREQAEAETEIDNLVDFFLTTEAPKHTIAQPTAKYIHGAPLQTGWSTEYLTRFDVFSDDPQTPLERYRSYCTRLEQHFRSGEFRFFCHDGDVASWMALKEFLSSCAEHGARVSQGSRYGLLKQLTDSLCVLLAKREAVAASVDAADFLTAFETAARARYRRDRDGYVITTGELTFSLPPEAVEDLFSNHPFRPGLFDEFDIDEPES